MNNDIFGHNALKFIINFLKLRKDSDSASCISLSSIPGTFPKSEPSILLRTVISTPFSTTVFQAFHLVRNGSLRIELFLDKKPVPHLDFNLPFKFSNALVQHSPWNSTLRLKIACERDFYVLRSHIDSTRFGPFNLNLNFRNHGYSTQWL